MRALIRACHPRNFSIVWRRRPDGRHDLFMYFEYPGTDYAADLRKMAADPETQRWWQLTDPGQEPLPVRVPGEWWAEIEEICHLD